MKLPPELLLDCLDHLHNDHETLKQLCLVNSLFKEPAQRFLFETLVLNSGLEKAKQQLGGLKGSELAKQVKTLDICGRAIVTKEEVQEFARSEEIMDGFIEPLTAHAKEFMSYLIPFLSAVKHNNNLQICIDAGREGFEYFWDVEPYLAVFLESVIFSLGCVEIPGLQMLNLGNISAGLLDRFLGDRDDFFLPDPLVPEDYDKDILDGNLKLIKALQISYHNEWDGESTLDSDTFDITITDFITLRPQITYLTLDATVESPVTLSPLKELPLKYLCLEELWLEPDGLIAVLSECKLESLALIWIVLNWNPAEDPDISRTWETVFDTCYNLPLVALNFNSLGSEYCKLGGCWDAGGPANLITERDEDIHAMKRLFRKVIESGGRVEGAKKLEDVDKVRVCRHISPPAEWDNSGGYTTCPARPKPKPNPPAPKKDGGGVGAEGEL